MGLLISVFDKKAAEYQEPQSFPNLATALRAYSSLHRQAPNSPLVNFPEDFSLYVVGNFDGVTGGVEPVIPPNYVEEMLSLVPSLVQKNNHDENKEVKRGN